MNRQFAYRRHIFLALILGYVCSAIVFTMIQGCGSASNPAVNHNSLSGKGTLTFTVQWPKRSRLVPIATNYIDVGVALHNVDIAPHQTIKPSSDGSPTTTIFHDIVADTVTVTATAYPDPSLSHTALASGTVTVPIIPNSSNAAELNMASTVSKIAITPTAPTITVGGQVSVTVSAKDAAGAMVLTPPGNWTWLSDTPAVVTISGTGLSVILNGLKPGTSNITVQENESKKNLQFAITVTAQNSGGGGLQPGSPWPKFHADLRNSGLGTGYGSTGVIKWQSQTSGPVQCSPAIAADGTVYVSSYGAPTSGYLYALDPKDGNQKWRFPTFNGFFSSPCIGTDGTVYVGSAGDGYVYAINPVDGTQKWKFRTGGSVYSSPTVANDGTVYVGASDNYMYALNRADGSLKWRFQTGGGVSASAAIGTDGTLYFGSADTYFYAVNPIDGSQKWKFHASTNLYGFAGSPALSSDGTIYVGANDGYLYAINSVDGSQRWRYLTGGQIWSCPAIGGDGTVFVGSQDHYLYAFSPSDGSMKWRFATNQPIVSSCPVISGDGTVYIGSRDGYLYAVNSSNGHQNWAFKTGNGVDSTAAISPDGTIYFGSSDYMVYALK